MRKSTLNLQGHIVIAMRHSWRLRLFALLFAPWFATVAADGPITHLCPLHGSHAVQSEQRAHAPSHMAEHHDSVPSPANHSQHCTCLGGCCASSSVGLPRSFDGAQVVTHSRRDDIVAASPTVFVSRIAYLLPFATAPPAL